VKSGESQLITPGGNPRVQLQFTLPSRLNGPGDATLPISFNATDAIVIGGTATPAAAQALGTYTNTITLTITLL
jgi:hypothetical protein